MQHQSCTCHHKKSKQAVHHQIHKQKILKKNKAVIQEFKVFVSRSFSKSSKLKINFFYSQHQIKKFPQRSNNILFSSRSKLQPLHTCKTFKQAVYKVSFLSSNQQEVTKKNFILFIKKETSNKQQKFTGMV